MILFKKLRWKNLLSTGNVFTEVTLNEHNTTLIIGENGAGKSTILDALSFALFSKPFRKVNKPQLINSITRKDLVVEIEFDINKIEYKIIRGIKPNIFELYQNSMLINQSAEMRDYQEILEKQILKINHKSFCQVVVLGSATFQPFMQLSAAHRREIIEDLLDLQIFTVMNGLLKDKVASNKDDIVQAEFDKRVVEGKIDLIKQHMQEQQSNNDTIIAEKTERLRETIDEMKTLNGEIETIETRAAELAKQTANLESLEKKVNKLDSLKHKIEANLEILKKEISFFTNHDNCPTCKQEIDVDFKCEAIDARNTNAIEIQDGLSKLTVEYDKTQAEIDNMLAINRQVRQLTMDAHVHTTKRLHLYRKM